MKFRWLLPPLTLALSLLALFGFAVAQGYPEKAALYYASRAAARSGGTLTVGSFEGNMKYGLTARNVEYRSGTARLKADAVFLKLRTTPLLFGNIWFKRLELKGVEGSVDGSGDGGGGFDVPLWLSVYCRKVSAEIERFEVTGPGGGAVENATLESKLLLRFGKFDLAGAKLRAEKTPFRHSVTFTGNLQFEPGNSLDLRGTAAFGRSRGNVRAKVRRRGKDLPLEVEIADGKIFLSDFREFADLPDLEATLDCKLSRSGKNYRISAEVDEKAFGRFTLNSSGTIEGTVARGSAAFSSAPFYYALGIPEIRSDKLKIAAGMRGDYTFDIQEMRLSGVFKGDLGRSEALGLEVDSGTAVVRLEGHDLFITSSFRCPLAGSGGMKLAYNFRTGDTDVDFDSSGCMVLGTLDALGIEVPLPRPLTFSGQVLDIDHGDLTFRERNMMVRVSAMDRSGGGYYAVINFEDLEISELGLRLDNVDPAPWGFEAPLRFTGELAFDLGGAIPGRTPSRLKNGTFRMEKMIVGPLDTGFDVMDTGVLVFPRMRVPFEGGEMSVSGELDRDGKFRGEAASAVLHLGRFPFTAGTGLEGELGGKFSFSGGLSSLTLSGGISSDKVSSGNLSLAGVSASGKLALGEGPGGCDLRLSAKKATAGGLGLSEAELVASGSLRELEYLFTAVADGAGKSSLKGVLRSTPDGELESEIDGGSLEVKGKNLYLARGASVSLKDGVFSLSGVKLESGDSKAFISLRTEPSETGRYVDAKVSSENFALAFFPLPKPLAGFRGRIDSDVRIKGPAGSPAFDGEVLLRNITFPVADSDVKVVGLVRAELKGNEVTFPNAYLTTNDGGEARLTGKIGMNGLLPGSFSLSLDGEDFPLVYRGDFAGLADFGLKLTGSAGEPRLEGSVRVLKGRLKVKDSLLAQDLPGSVVFVNTGKEPSGEEEAAPAVFMTNLRGGVNVVSEGKLWVTRKDLIAELTGSVLVRFTKDGISPEGKLTIAAGRFLMQGNKFDLKDSSLYFSGGKDLLPILDVKASKEIGDYEVAVRLQGQAEKPTLTLSSVPPLAQEDVLSLILFGRPSQGLDPQENAKWGGAAVALAFSYEASPLLRAVSKKVKLDTLQVGTSESGDPQLGFSKYLSDRFILEYEQTFGSLNEGKVNLRYRINRHLSLETTSSTSGESGADVIWEQKY